MFVVLLGVQAAFAVNTPVGPVTKNPNTGDLSADLNVPSGQTLQIKSGGTLNGAGTFDLSTGTVVWPSGPLTTLAGLADSAGVLANSGSAISWSNSAGVGQAAQIYCLGDSITRAGYYVTTLQSLLGAPWNCVNRGVSGNTTADLIARLPIAVSDWGDAQYVTVLIGVNDCIAGTLSAAQIEAKLQTIYTDIAATGAKVVAMTIMPFGNNSAWTSGKEAVRTAANSWILSNNPTGVYAKIDMATVCAQEGSPQNLNPSYDNGDGLHPNSTGGTAMGNALLSGVTWTRTDTAFKTYMAARNLVFNQDVSTGGSPYFPSATLGFASTTTPGLILYPGSLTTTAVSGAIENDGVDPWFTNTALSRRKFAFVLGQPQFGSIGLGLDPTSTANLQTNLFSCEASTSGIGTISVSQNGTTVTGTGTCFYHQFKIGDTITANGETHTISAMASTTSMTTDAWSATASNVSFTANGLGNQNLWLGDNGALSLGTTQYAVTTTYVPLSIYGSWTNTGAITGCMSYPIIAQTGASSSSNFYAGNFMQNIGATNTQNITGNVISLRGMTAVQSSAAGTFSYAIGGQVGYTIGTTGTITNGMGLDVSAATSGGGSVYNDSGVVITERGGIASHGNINLLMGTRSAPSGTYNIYQSSASANYLGTGLTTVGTFTATPSARTSGSASYFIVNGPSDTGLTASTESIGGKLVGGTRTWSDGTVAAQREFSFQAPTYNKTTTSATFTKAATLAIDAAPVAGSGVTITNPYALWVQAGASQLDGGVVTTTVAASSSVMSSAATAGVGYTSGAGGTISQTTNRSTGVTINKICGTITTYTTSLAAGASATFTVTDSAVAIGDVPTVVIRSGQTNKETNVRVTAVAAGSFDITVFNQHASTAETGAIVINFAVIKATTS